MPDYKQGKIYSLRSYQTDQVYIGSTTQPLYKRLYAHKKNYTLWLDKKYGYSSAFEIIRYDDVYIEIIEEFSCNNKMELERREGELIRRIECVNKRVAGRTQQEYVSDNKIRINEKQKQYYEGNKDKRINYAKTYHEKNRDQILQKKKEYRETNKEKLNEKQKKYYEENKDKRINYAKTYMKKNREQILQKKRLYGSINVQCSCGSWFRKDSIQKHIKTRTHYDNIIGLSVFGL